MWRHFPLIVQTVFIFILFNRYCSTITDGDQVAPIIFYDVKTHEPFEMHQTEVTDGNNLKKKSRPVFMGKANGCNCQELVCGCCAGIQMEQFNFNQEGCMNFTYDPNEFSIGMNMLFNENSIYMNSVSALHVQLLKSELLAKNPPPLCIPIPTMVPFLPIPGPSLEMCVKLFNIFTPGRNLHMCMDMEFRLERASLFVLHFDCMRMGADGFALVKPDEENGGLSTEFSGNIQPTPTQQASDVFDPVTEIII